MKWPLDRQKTEEESPSEGAQKEFADWVWSSKTELEERERFTRWRMEEEPGGGESESIREELKRKAPSMGLKDSEETSNSEKSEPAEPTAILSLRTEEAEQ